MHYALAELWVLRLNLSYKHLVPSAHEPLRVSVDLCVSVVESSRRQFTTEAQRSTERHKGNNLFGRY